ncbi:MAG: sulfotransferase family protein [Calditrichaeota bacterium]|nr:MAG: sulfotransferase family protein [Calditrichota bacterium]MBL1203884.1 sulfotransferase family protein [Calditrichota bacterium]NOG43716.1 sulfotransferase family protein [Calditrichota bacterium]
MNNKITIVSGLPRSGTSMMMKVLQKGGMTLVYDDLRVADNDNPNGYFEYAKVKNLKEDNSWLFDAQGQAIKILFNFLYFLPQKYKFKIIFMQRNMQEILASQNKMLLRSGKSIGQDNRQFEILFNSEIIKCKDWLKNQKNIDTINVSYNQIMETPFPICQSINNFLEKSLNLDGMVNAIDKSLYRNKSDKL